VLDKRHKSYETNIQALSDSIKRPNLRNMGIKEGEEGASQRDIQQNYNKKFPKS
jgi:hypothetical protein